MKALDYPAWNTLEVTDSAIPKPATKELVLKVAACGICGSELETFKNRSPRRTPPLIMGHEFCGVITEIGAQVDGLKIGESVVSNSVVPCRKCKSCARGDLHLCPSRQIFGMHRQGAFAEYVNVPADCLIEWPQDLAAESACLAEPLANGIHVVNSIRHLKPEAVVILGAGPIGLMCQQAMQVIIGGEITMVDLIDERLDMARHLGTAHKVNASREDVHKFTADLTDGEGVDLVIDSAGSQLTKKQSLELCRPGGAVVWIGLHQNVVQLDSYEITLSEKTVFGSYAATLTELRDAVDLLTSGLVRTQDWVQSFSLDNGAEAFRRMLEAKGDDIKAVLIP